MVVHNHQGRIDNNPGYLSLTGARKRLAISSFLLAVSNIQYKAISRPNITQQVYDQ